MTPTELEAQWTVMAAQREFRRIEKLPDGSEDDKNRLRNVWVQTQRDVTERRLIEQRMEELRLRDELAARGVIKPKAAGESQPTGAQGEALARPTARHPRAEEEGKL